MVNFIFVIYFEQEFSTKLEQISRTARRPIGMASQSVCQSTIKLQAQPAKTEGEVKGVRLIGFQSVDVEEAISTLRKELKKLIMEDDWSNSPHKKWIPKLSSLQVCCLSGSKLCFRQTH